MEKKKKGWTLYGLDTHRFFVSRDVHFLENDFPFASFSLNSEQSDQNSSSPNSPFDSDYFSSSGSLSSLLAQLSSCLFQA